MTDDAKVLDYLRIQFGRVHERLDSLGTDMIEVKQRLGFLEGHYGSLSRRVDRIEQRLDRIERHVDLIGEPAP